MSDKRTVQDVQRDYASVCTQLGDIGYKMLALEDVKKKLHNQCRDLDKELNRLQAQVEADKANAAKEVAPAAEVVSEP